MRRRGHDALAVDSLTPDRWRTVKAVLDGAMDLDPPEHPAFLDEACRDDTALRREVEALLEAEAAAPAFLDADAARFCEPLLPEIPEPSAPERVGPYRVVREVGRGGMGRVYLAERADGQFEQRVALKLLRPGLDTEDVVRRFLVERQILASLSHPGIARLLDGGTTGDGRPYVVMEYVEGEPITAYCDARRLSVDARLALFREVGRAVAYAHRNLVVHRDLKPSNILVTDDGQVKLLDFGIAKLLDADAKGHLTGTGLPVMTPAWASPEQVRGEPVTTASDVYQLGLLLYELLTGQRAYEVDTRSPGRMERTVCEQTPPPPSVALARPGDPTHVVEAGYQRATRPDRLRRRLAGDLDTICLKALRKEPERRYDSVGEMMDDVRRHQEGHPVSARPDSLAYRVRTFVRRHRRGVATAAGAVLLLSGLGVYHMAQVTAERDRARRETQKAERVTTFLTGLFEQADPYRTSGARDLEAALTVLEPAAERVRQELADEPEVQAELLHTLGALYRQMGRRDLAAPMLRRALALRQATLGPVHEDVGATLHELALARENPDSTLATLDRAIAVRRAAFAGDHPDLAASLLVKAQRLPYGHPDKDATFAEARAMLGRLYGPRSPEVADALSEFMMGYEDRERAEAMVREAIAIYREHGPAYDPQRAVAMNNLSLFLDGAGRPAESLALLQRSYALTLASAGEQNYETSLLGINLAGTLYEHDRYAEADTLLRGVLDLRRRIMPDSSNGVAFTLYWYGRNLTALGRLDEAEAALREGLAICERLYDEPATLPLLLQATLGHTLARQGQTAEARRLMEEAYRIGRAHWGEGHPLARRIAGHIAELPHR